MGTYVQDVLALQNLQRKQAIAKNQDATLNIAKVIRSGVNPQTGAALTPAEVMELTNHHKLLTAQGQDLWNAHQDVNKLGKTAADASGVALPESMGRRLLEKAHLAKPGAPSERQSATVSSPEVKNGVGGINLPAASVTAQGPRKNPQQQMQDLRAITDKYQTQPGQNEAEAANTELQSKLRAIDADPNLTKEEKADARRKAYGVGDHPTLKLYTLPDGTKTWLDAARPDLIPPGATAATTETSDTRARSDYDAFKAQNPDYTGSFEQWKAEQGAKGRATGKPETFDQKYQDVLLKEKQGRPLSKDDEALKAAWGLWNQEKYIAPAVAKAAAYGANRFVAVLDPTDPEKVVMMRAGEAAKAGVGTPQSMSFQIDKAVTRAFTSGKQADTINYFNTAVDHLNILSETADALNNGNMQVFNKYANAFANATGDAAPSNFETVRNAVAGELAKTFKGTGATDEEISLITSTINSSQSPSQLKSNINYYLKLMRSKLGALETQFNEGKKGKPAFNNDIDDIVKGLKKLNGGK